MPVDNVTACQSWSYCTLSKWSFLFLGQKGGTWFIYHPYMCTTRVCVYFNKNYLPSLTPPPFNPSTSTPVIRIFSHVFMTQTASQNSRLPTLLALPAKPQINVNAHTFFMPRVTGRAVGLPRVQFRPFHVPHDFLFLLFVQSKLTVLKDGNPTCVRKRSFGSFWSL